MKITKLELKILETIQKMQFASPSTIAAMLNANVTSIRTILVKLVNYDLVKRTQKGVYEITNEGIKTINATNKIIEDMTAGFQPSVSL